jgi:hypothetical protein
VFVPILAQLTASVALAGTVASSAPGLRDREVFGVRYRTPAVAGFTAQVGVVSVNENGIVFPSNGGVRHWAVGAEYAVRPWWRTALIYGTFDEFRATPTTAPPSTYYRLFAVGNTFTIGHTAVTVEKLLQAPLQEHAAIHDVVVQAHGAWWDVLASSLHGSYDQPAYHFVVAEVTVRPFARLPGPLKFVGLEGGTRALPAPNADREMLVHFVAAGLFFAWVQR